MRLTRLCCPRWVAALLLAAAPLASRADDAPHGYAEQLARLLPAVVTIQTAATTPEGRTFFDGFGFVIDPSGVILTNRHVITGAYAISVTVPNIGQLDAKALYISGVPDVALLKVKAGNRCRRSGSATARADHAQECRDLSWPRPSHAFATPSDTGIILGPLARSARVRPGLNADTKGVLVTAVEPHTAAAERTIAAGDVMLAVGDTTVADPDGVKRALQAVT